ncbi:MAG: flagellar motor switch protein FliG [Planctomycetia bacterium]|nr:flagellar motor switch protein FliG [Planctomycetia bacterium]
MPANDVRKAAIILMSLPEDEAAGIIAQLEPKQLEAVMVEIAKIGSIPGDEQSAVINDFAQASPASTETGGLEKAKALVEKALGTKAGTALDSVRQHIEAVPFSFLKNVDSQNLLTFILDEHPQTIALILCHLPPQRAAEVLTALPADQQLAVVRRVANMGQTNPAIIAEVEEGLERRMSTIMRHQFENAGGVKAVAEILNVTDRSVERNLLENLTQDDSDLVEEIRRLMFVFDDIIKLTDKDIQTVLKNVETAQWAMALKGTSDELKQKILGNMSQRAAQSLKEEMEYLGPKRTSEVESVRQQVVDMIRKLEDAGEIAVHGPDDDEQLIE